MATARVLLKSKPLGHVSPPSSSSSSAFSSFTVVKCLGNNKAAARLSTGDYIQKMVSGETDKIKGKVSAMAVVVKATAADTLIIAEPRVDRSGILNLLPSLLATVANALIKFLRSAVKRKPRRFMVQMFLEKAIVDCRFFALFAVVGSLLGSVLCFLEGCFIILESYFQYFNSFSLNSEQGHIVQLLIEALDKFLVGTAMLTFGVGLYVMFVGSKHSKEKAGLWLPESNMFGLFGLKAIPPWVEMRSVSQAKSKIGHAVMMILQVGMLEKFKNIPLVTSLDLACFAGAVVVSSACIFLLSRLSVGAMTEDR